MKKYFLILAILFLPLISNGDQGNGLVGWWGMDTRDYPSISSVSLFDRSGNGNNGTLTPSTGNQFTATSTVLGQVGQSLAFNGNSQYVLLPNVSVYNFASTSNFTLTAWVYPMATKSQYIFNKIDTGGNGGYNWGLSNSNATSFFVRDGNGNASNQVHGNTSYVLNKWTFLCVVYTSPSADDITFYYNGKNDGMSILNKNLGSVSGTAQIGNSLNTAGYFNGRIDDVRVYNRALSAGEINDIYRHGGAISKGSFIDSIQGMISSIF